MMRSRGQRQSSFTSTRMINGVRIRWRYKHVKHKNKRQERKRTIQNGIYLRGGFRSNLKLTRVITWSWWWVLSPMWISILLLIVVLIIGMLLDG